MLSPNSPRAPDQQHRRLFADWASLLEHRSLMGMIDRSRCPLGENVRYAFRFSVIFAPFFCVRFLAPFGEVTTKQLAEPFYLGLTLFLKPFSQPRIHRWPGCYRAVRIQECT